MDPLVGALVAAGIGWASIVAAALVPTPWLDGGRLRAVGGAVLVVLGLTVAGLPLPGTAPLAVLVAGLGWAAWPRRAQTV